MWNKLPLDLSNLRMGLPRVPCSHLPMDPVGGQAVGPGRAGGVGGVSRGAGYITWERLLWGEEGMQLH